MVLNLLLSALLAVSIGAAPPDGPATESARIARVNERFLKHLESLGRERALAVASVREAWERRYRAAAPESFVPEALGVLYPQYAEALHAYDEGRAADAGRLLEPLALHDDAFLAANATYFFARALLEQARLEEAEALLDQTLAAPERFEPFTPLAPHAWFLRGVCAARNLRFDRAAVWLQALAERFAHPPEMIEIGARQLRLELERREQGTLDEVARVMDYVSDRLHAADATERVRQRQDDIIALLDRLIQEQQQREGQRGGRSARGGKSRGPVPGETPSSPRSESVAPEGEGRIGDLHAAPPVTPGEMWGKLPPAEREKILQSIRERFPSRYRYLVEQYYRSLAEDK